VNTFLKKKGRGKPPSFSNIVVAQRDIIYSLDIPINSAEKTCWSCKKYFSSNLEKAHIVAFSKGGSNLPDNYFLLCHNCHTNQPDGAPPDYQIEWLQKRPQFWEVRFDANPFKSEFELMSGIKIQEFFGLIIDRHGTYGLRGVFKKTLKGGTIAKAGMTSGNAMANAVHAFVHLYRSEYLDK